MNFFKPKMKLGVVLAALILLAVFFSSCPTDTTPTDTPTGKRTEIDVYALLLEKVIDVSTVYDSIRTSEDGQDVYDVYLWLTPADKAALVKAYHDALDLLEDHAYVTPNEIMSVLEVLEYEYAKLKPGLKPSPDYLVILKELIDEATKYASASYLKKTTNGYYLYSFNAWITPAEYNSVGIEAQLAAAREVFAAVDPDDPDAPGEPEIVSAKLALQAKIDVLKTLIRAGLTYPPDGANVIIDGLISAYSAADHSTAEGTGSTTIANALAPSTGRWNSDKTDPVIEIEYAFPVEIGKIELLPYGTAGDTSGDINGYTFEYWDMENEEWVTAYEHSGSRLPGNSVSNHSYLYTYDFGTEFVSTKFRLSLRSRNTTAVSLWAVRLIKRTYGRAALNNTITEANTDWTTTPVSRVNGVNIDPMYKWVDLETSTALANAIAAARIAANNLTAKAEDVAAAQDALDSAWDAFETSKQVGNGTPEFVTAYATLEREILDGYSMISAVFITDNPAEIAADKYDIHLFATEPTVDTFRTVLDQQNEARLLIDTYQLLLDAIDVVRAAVEQFNTGGIVRGANPFTYTDGMNVAPYYMVATEEGGYPDSGVWNDEDNGYMHNGSFGDSLKNTTWNTSWGKHTTTAQGGTHPGCGWVTNTWGRSGTVTEPDKRGDLFPLKAYVNFGVAFPISEIAIFFMNGGEGNAATTYYNATNRAGGRVGNYDIEYMDMETMEWKLAWRREHTANAVNGIREAHFNATAANWTGTNAVRRASSKFGPDYNGTIEGVTGTTEVTTAVIRSNQFRFTFWGSPYYTPTDWSGSEWMVGPRFYKFEFITDGPLDP